MSYATEVLTDTPILWYPMQEKTGYWAREEIAGADGFYQQSTVTPGGPTLDQGGPGGATAGVSFDGTNDWMRIAASNILAISSAWTIEAWIRAPSGETQLAPIFNQHFDGSKINMLLGFWNGSARSLKPSINFYNGGWRFAQSASDISLDAWHYLVGTWDGTQLEIWVDKVSKATNTPGSSPSTPSDNQYMVGWQYDQGSIFFKGRIAHVAVYNTKLSSTRIAAHYDAMVPAAGAAVIDAPIAKAKATRLEATVDQKNVDPSTIAGGPKVWLIADEIKGLSDGTVVDEWPDVSGNSRHARNVGSRYRPVFKSNIARGHASVRFDGVNDVMFLEDLAALFPSAATAFIVYGFAGSDNDFKLLEFNHHDGWTDFGGAGYWDDFRTNRISNYPSSVSGSGRHTLSILSSASTYQAFKDGVAQTAQTASYEAPSDNSMIGGSLNDANNQNRYLGGDIFEVILFDSALTAAQIHDVDAYLQGRYLVQVNTVYTTEAIASALTPTIDAGTTQVNAPMATATAAANAPSLKLDYSVTAPMATATGAAIAPTLDLTGGTTITPPMAAATGAANAPTLKVDTIVTAPQATATGAANAPTISHPLIAPMATASATANTPKPPPANDNFVNALLVTGATGFTSAIDLDAATTEVGEPVGINLDDYPRAHSTIWFKWVAPSGGQVTFSTEQSTPRAGSPFSGDPSGHLDTTMAVWTGASLGTLVEVDSNDDVNDPTDPTEPDNWYSLVTFTAVGGTTYYIQVGVNAANVRGDAVLNWAIDVNLTLDAPVANAIASAPNEVIGPGRTPQETGTIPAISRRALQAAIGVTKGIPGVGAVEHMIVAATGEVDYPIVGEAEWDEQVPGGWWTATGLVTKRQRRMHLGVYKEGSTWMIFESATGHLIWQGKLNQPKREEEQIRIEADGLGKRLTEANIRHRMLYQTWDLSEWQQSMSGTPFSNDPGNTLDTAGEAGTVNDKWNLEIGNGLVFTRQNYSLNAESAGGPSYLGNGPTFENESPHATFFADDLAEPGLTNLKFIVHLYAQPDNSFSGIDVFDNPPFPPFMKVLAGRWDPRLADASQGGWFGEPVIWMPDKDGAGQFNYSEFYNVWTRWNISPFYTANGSYLFAGSAWTSSGGDYSPWPYAFSDRVGDRSDFVMGSESGLVSQEPGLGRVWDNRPFTRPSVVAGTYHFNPWDSTNFVDPNAVRKMEINAGFVDRDYWDPYPVNSFSIAWQDNTDLYGATGDNVMHVRALLIDVRVNGIAFGDQFSVSEMARDVARRRGLSDAGVHSNAICALPYDLKEGTWADILDHCALLSGWIWRITADPDGGRPRLDFKRWGRTGGYIVDDDRTPFNLEPTQRYFSVDVPFKYPATNEISGVAHVRWPDVPPGAMRDYGLIQLDQPVQTRELAHNLGLRILNRLRKRHLAGNATISKVRQRDGMEQSAYLVSAGNVIHHWPSHRKLRVQSVRKTYQGVDLTFDWGNAVVDAITARRNLRMSTRQRS